MNANVARTVLNLRCIKSNKILITAVFITDLIMPLHGEQICASLKLKRIEVQ